MDYINEVGLPIANLRDSQGMTQADLAAAVEKSSKTISDIETGKVATSLETFIAIAKALDAPVWRLFEFAEEHKGLSASRLAQAAELLAQLRDLPDKEFYFIKRLADVVVEEYGASGTASGR